MVIKGHCQSMVKKSNLHLVNLTNDNISFLRQTQELGFEQLGLILDMMVVTTFVDFRLASWKLLLSVLHF